MSKSSFEIVKNGKLAKGEVDNLRVSVGFKPLAEKLEKGLSNSYATYSIRDGEKLIGFIRIISDGNTHAYIADLMIHPDYQSRGLGRKILERAIEDSKKDGFPFIELTFRCGLEDFYKSVGFQIIAAGLIQ